MAPNPAQGAPPLTLTAQPFPKITAPLVDPATGNIELPWYKLLATLWRKLFASTADALVAAGSRQDTALKLGADWNVVTVSPGGTGVMLPQLALGNELRVWNLSANAINVYPFDGWQIDALAVNAPYVLAPGKAQVLSVRTLKRYLSLQLG